MNKIKTKIIGIGGCALVGKDSLYEILSKILKENNIITSRLALADPLKAEVNEFTKNNYNISAFTKNPAEKELIRPIFLCHGKIKRSQTNGKYFTSKASSILEDNIKNNILTICTDIRYANYSEDEIYWLRSNGGILIHIERTGLDGRPVQPANLDEKENDPKICQSSDFKFKWPTTNDLTLREDIVKVQLKELIDLLINENK